MLEFVLVLGATSGIGKPLCHRLAARGRPLILAGRNAEELARLSADIELRHQSRAVAVPFEATDFNSHASFFERCRSLANDRVEGFIYCAGYLPDQANTQRDVADARRCIDINFTAAVSLLHLAALFFEERDAQARGNCFIAAISSVAGDRGRQSNYTYGASKAGLTAFLQGLRNRLHHCGVHVLTIKPGFVDTPMTHGRINPDSPLTAAPEQVAKDIDRAIQRRTNTLYTRWFWRWIMTVVCLIPESVFKRLKF